MKIDRISITKGKRDEVLASVSVYINNMIFRGIKIIINEQGELDIRLPSCINSFVVYSYIDFQNSIDYFDFKEKIINYYKEIEDDEELDLKVFYPNYNNMENIEDLLSDLEVLHTDEISLNIIKKLREKLDIV